VIATSAANSSSSSNARDSVKLRDVMRQGGTERRVEPDATHRW
jgi:hypothetical protein